MGKKKRGHPDVEEILARPWCYYCERDFDDLKILISHQKAKHFKCERCGRRLNTAGGLSVHMNQVHKETLTTVENALPNRSNLDVEIFGMEGIPEDVVASHQQRVLSQIQQAEAERRAATGNPASGTAGGSAPKKAKFESPAEIKKRLAEHKAKVKMLEQAGDGSSGGVTPGGGIDQTSPSPGMGQSPVSYPQSASPSFLQQPTPYPPPTTGAVYPAYAPPYDPSAFPHAPPGFSPSQAPPGTTAAGSHIPGFPPHPASGAPGFPPGPPGGNRPFTAVAPPMPYSQGYPPPGRDQSPAQVGSLPPRAPSLPPTAPGLPQRPSFAAPPVNAFQMQQLHQGQALGPPPHAPAEAAPGGFPGGFPGASSNGDTGAPGLGSASLVSPLQNTTLSATPGRDAAKATEPAGEKKGKKDKDKATKMVYSDDQVSPEEKMARLPRYAFAPSRKTESVLDDATTAAVTGVVTGPDDVVDRQG
ncbi:MAG: hypothetical protein M1838_003288 [Thelocarpon superellum]|nr:MAG: hypothetical protein M1838_003288 [Thelocarpon superellum]